LLDASIEQGYRLQRLIDELLLVAAAEHEESEAVRVETEIAPLVSEVEHELRHSTGGRLELHIDSNVGRVIADPSRLRQILLNLVDNAAKYAPNGAIALRVTAERGDVSFAVIDHGPGIPEADRTRVFEQFVQLDQSSTRRQGGTGLGLYLCRELASVLSGTLTLGEVAGGGCCFTLTIPRGAVAAAATDPEDQPETEPSAPPKFAGVRTRPPEFARVLESATRAES
jgi:signal transduction histidine kinase